MSEVLAHELYSLLVPLAQERLIVPRACVAEVVTWQAPEKMEGAPQWYLGTIHWSGRAVPVISFEAACGQSPPNPGTRTRIVIFVALSSQIAGGYFGVIGIHVRDRALLGCDQVLGAREIGQHVGGR